MKLKVGDYVLATAFAYFEKCLITSIDGNTAVLENGIKFNTKTWEPKNSKCKLEVFDQGIYDMLVARLELPKMVLALQTLVASNKLADTEVIMIHRKISKIVKNA